MKKIVPIIIALCLVGVGTYLYFNPVTLNAPEDEEIVTTPPLVQDENYCLAISNLKNGIASPYIISEIETFDTVREGYLLRGCIRNIDGSYGNWSPFEGQVGSYALFGEDDTLLIEGPLTVSGADNWLDYANSNRDIPFETTVTLGQHPFTTGYIVFRNENASGETETSESFKVYVNY